MTNAHLTKIAKVIGIIAGVLTISGVLFGAIRSYAALYIETKMAGVENKLTGVDQKLDDVIERLDRNGLK